MAIAVSNEVALSMQLNLLLSPLRPHGRLRVRTVQNGVNIHQFARSTKQAMELRRALGIPEEAFVVGKVAVFRSQKRLWLWVEVALELLKNAPDTHFLLVGDGDWKEKILNQIQVSGKAANFHCVGVQKQVVPYLSCMDVYMSSSEFEGLPIAMLEAMACGVPVVATRAGGIGEVIQDGVEGFLCNVENWQELKPLVLRLIQDRNLQEKFSAAARKRVEEEFSMETMVQQLEEIYYQVLEKYSYA
ncbi:glycosyltransferase [Mongoliitalea lutea]|uniref:glycosyltransferase n=1 Tax=Mongoliitalea lutea TaxID=849756 RepID=UPI001E29E058|nr:glycosyltransferase [Mongoliitalea lutea]